MCSTAWTPLRINRWSSQILSQMWWDMLHDCGYISFTVGPGLPRNMSLLLMVYGKGLQEQNGSHRCCREAVTCSGCHCWSSRHCIPKNNAQTSMTIHENEKEIVIKTLTIKTGHLSMLIPSMNCDSLLIITLLIMEPVSCVNNDDNISKNYN